MHVLAVCVIWITLVHEACSNPLPAAINVRLVNGPDSSQGRVEIQNAEGGNVDENTWGTICNDMYENNNKAATVICRQLGYIWGEAAPNERFGSAPRDLPIFLDDVMCTGSENSLTNCTSSGWGDHNCYHAEDVGAVCHNKTVRLQYPLDQSNVGVVQVYSEYNWVDVCDREWDNMAANVVCKELGYVHGIAECCSALGPSHFRRVIIDSTAGPGSSNLAKSFTYTCNGTEEHLVDCSNNSYTAKCEYSHRASVVCHNVTEDKVNTDFDIRITDGADFWGRVEVRHSGIWGLVCNDGWSDEHANVTCRQFGYLGGVAFGSVTTPSMPFWLVDVDCKGDEKGIEHCSFAQWGQPLLLSCKAAYVLCYKTSGLQIDFVDGTLPSNGRVQITYDGVPGSLCTNEWTDNDAFIACRMKGYSDGIVRLADSPPKANPPYYMNRLICDVTKVTSLFHCSSYGWQVKTDKCKESAYITCFSQVRLSGGTDNSGIVELFDMNQWMGLCDYGIKPEHADLICQELGHKAGSLLMPGAYGKYFRHIGRPHLNCSSNATSILDCDYDKTVKCVSTKYYHYVSVSCHENKTETGPQYRLIGNAPEPTFGRIVLKRLGVWGEICGDWWTDADATVYCRTFLGDQGYNQGVAVFYPETAKMPTLVSGMICHGNETSFHNCSSMLHSSCHTSMSAGVICYKRTAPTVHLVDGGWNFGRVELVSDDVRGSVCDYTWTDREATVVCKELNRNFTQGIVYNAPPGKGEVLLSSIYCSGVESSLLKCTNDGWRNVAHDLCLDHSHDVGVYCFGHVRLVDGVQTGSLITGRVEIQDSTIFDSSGWIGICGEYFNKQDADTICRDLGFDVSEILAPGSFGVSPSWIYFTNMSCAENGSDVLRDCKYKTGLCQLSTHNYASLMCLKADVKPDFKVFIENGDHGLVIIQQYGINGTICVDGWDDTDASVLCRSHGFKGGVVFGGREIFVRTLPIWFTNMNCLGTERDIFHCPRNKSVGIECTMSLKAAGVLCYKETGIHVKLVNNENKNYYGRVEIEVDGERGTVCDASWSTYDARVLCRQLGFPDGQAYPKSYYGAGNGSVYLSSMTCDSTEPSLLACPSSGWKKSPAYCRLHDRDAGVRCKRNVITQQGNNYGTVSVWHNGGYHLVCAEQFDDDDATVVCRSMGYEYGKSICCSAFGHQIGDIGIARSRCYGNEMNYNDCEKDYGEAFCPSGDYASVVCSREAPVPGLDVWVEEFSHGMGSGPVMVEYLGKSGYLCTEKFDDLDAMVTCRQLEYRGGYSYRSVNDDVKMRATRKLRWARGPDCVGDEKQLSSCPGLVLGNVSNCSISSLASAFCYREPAQSEFAVRLQNAPHPGEGFVQVKVNNTWGSICVVDTIISNTEATVICRQLGFKYGLLVPMATYKSLTGHIWLTDLQCNGSETELRQCVMSGIGASVSRVCRSHVHDMAIKCYTHVKLSSSNLPNYGMLEVLNTTDNSLVSVCDTDFDDDDARVVCRSMGYQDGKSQCCSPMGPKLTAYRPIKVANVNCTGVDRDFSKCVYTMGDVKCPSGNYAAVLCTDSSPPIEGLKGRISGGHHLGNVEVTRYGVNGSVCDELWTDKEARVLCRSLGYTGGNAFNGTNTADVPMLMTSIRCLGNESDLSQCQYPPLVEGHKCTGRRSRAAVVCTDTPAPIKYRVADRGRAEVYMDGRWGTICRTFWEDNDSSVFCRSAGYGGGENTKILSKPASPDQPVWMSNVECTGQETSLQQCRASWDKKSLACSHERLAYVKCIKKIVRLSEDGHGFVQIYDRRKKWLNLCEDYFTQKEADVTCRDVGYEHAIRHCCTRFRNPYSTYHMFRHCNGNETDIKDCELDHNLKSCRRSDNAYVSCYNGTANSSDFKLAIKGSSRSAGQIVLTYLGTDGNICAEGWDNKDAQVVCRQLGFKNGTAYHHYRSRYFANTAPFWTSNVECAGNETHLRQCKKTELGNVTGCAKNDYAGVTCIDTADIAYRVTGGDDRYGRVEFFYNNEWNTICSNAWSGNDASVVCHGLGYGAGGIIYAGEYKNSSSGPTYTIDFHCLGNEESLHQCPRGDIEEFTGSCKTLSGVYCTKHVKIGPYSKSKKSGSVHYRHDGRWGPVCDEGFDDVTAQMVCQTMGHFDGRAICCSAFDIAYNKMQKDIQLHCTGNETYLDECVIKKTCNSSAYASVLCFNKDEPILEDEYIITNSDKDQGPLEVMHLGVKGRICSESWDDNDAQVYCRSKGYGNGIAYKHTMPARGLRERVYWLGGFNCTGTEPDLMSCSHRDRLDLGGCARDKAAAVLCFNESGIQYRMADGNDRYGRVELSIGDRWGTVCDRNWDHREAMVFCRQINPEFTDGEAVGGAHFGPGKGPIWLSHLRCTGTEPSLHQCEHKGFSTEYSFINWWYPNPCETHGDDAGVICYKTVRLSNGPTTQSGGLQMNKDGSWYGVCDKGFTNTEALVACRSLSTEYVAARAIPGSAYGKKPGPILFSDVRCLGNETDIADCKYLFNQTCPSGHFVSIFCSNETIEDDGFKLRLAPDSLSSNIHGILEARIGGIWGRICIHGFNDKDASVACKEFGYDGGVAYLHIMKNDRPVLVRDVQCLGNETSLEKCPHKQMSPDLINCHYGTNDAGVICYNNSLVPDQVEEKGFSYRLKGGVDPSVGRVEIGYHGKWGMVCAWSWQTADAQVLCRSLGYKDGIVNYTSNSELSYARPWVTGFFCRGKERTLMTCLNTGFDSRFLTDLCYGSSEPGAYSQCFNETVGVLDIRLVNGPNKYTGRVEVLVSGANQWGTICDDHWDDDDAGVVCKQLGFSGGTALRYAPYGHGSGPIWFDNLKCQGNETSLSDCGHRGIGTHNCKHKEDVSVRCAAPSVPTVATNRTLASTTATTTATTIITTTAVTSAASSTTATTTPTITTTNTSFSTPASTSPSTTSAVPSTASSPTLASTTAPTTLSTTPSSTAITSQASASTTTSVTTQPSTEVPKKVTTQPSILHSSSTANQPSTMYSTEGTTTTTTKTTTARRTSKLTTISSSTTSTPRGTTVPISEEPSSNRTLNVPLVASSAGTSLGAAIAVPVIVVILIGVIIAVVMFVKLRKTQNMGYTQEHFDDTVVNREPDGSINVSNQMYGVASPQSPGAFSDVSTDDDKMMLTKNGKAFFSKGLTNGNNVSEGAFTNPLYDVNSVADSNEQNVLRHLPENGELSLPENSSASV